MVFMYRIIVNEAVLCQTLNNLKFVVHIALGMHFHFNGFLLEISKLKLSRRKTLGFGKSQQVYYS